jgi:hypothetical protein
MKHDILCVAHFNALESLLWAISSTQSTKIRCYYNAESLFPKDIRYFVIPMPEFKEIDGSGRQ